MTPDGISTEDWGRVHDLALAIVGAADEPETYEAHRQELCVLLNELEERYGLRPSILATRADYTAEPGEAGPLLEQAYALAVASGDCRNALYAACSLVDFSLAELRSVHDAQRWLAAALRHTEECGDDSDRRECTRLQAALARAIRPI